MKKSFFSFLFFVLSANLLHGAYVGKVYFKPQPGELTHQIFRVPASLLESYNAEARASGKLGLDSRTDGSSQRDAQNQLAQLQAYFQAEKDKGNLKIRLIQDDPEARMQHFRYAQYYKGLEVFGGEIIEHFKDGQLTNINGEYYEVPDVEIVPLISKEEAVQQFMIDLGEQDLLERTDETRLVIFPIGVSEYRLAFRLILRKTYGYSMTGIVDAKNGEVLLRSSNIKNDELTIGTGIGFHGETYKLPTTFSDSKYWLMDKKKARPINQYTFVVLPGVYMPVDSDNYWDSDGVAVNVHVFEGLIYDYYYLVQSRKGIDDNNMDVRATIHPLAILFGTDNAYWDGDSKQMYFCDPYYTAMRTGAALDVIAHEFTHGVTQFTSRLSGDSRSLFNEPDTLSESFSDIMATAIEFYWQSPGNSFNKADWILGEDTYPIYGYYLRNPGNPNSISQYGDPGHPDPCHLDQLIADTRHRDGGGVHWNSTLYSHAFYLLSEGGTNKVSRVNVAGLGINKATRIFYNTWVHHLTITSDFFAAANQLVQSAIELYGSSSNEKAQTVKTMEAIGW